MSSKKNSNLHNAKRAKQDEFYTQWVDIETEMNAYLDYNPDVFRDKTILLPCDDPSWSNFTKYFALRFEDYGIKKLISTSYAPKSNMDGMFYEPEPGLFEDAFYDEQKDFEHGKIFVLEQGKDSNRDGRINIEDFEWEYLEGDGDFRSDEITALRDEADMVITNPPFSLFREFIAWLIEGEVEFSIIGNMNAITYKEVFPLIKNNKVWIGASGMKSMEYEIPKVYAGGKKNQRIDENGVHYQKLGNTCWFANIEHGRRHEPLPLMSMEDNLRYNSRIFNNPNSYKKYDNYDAIEVPVTAGIPNDYTIEKWVTDDEYDALVDNGYVLEVLEERERERERERGAHSESLNGCSNQFPGQVQSRTVRDTRNGSLYCSKECSCARESCNQRETNICKNTHTIQSRERNIRILNPIMGVPISFLDKYCPDQFEILGSQRWSKSQELLDIYTGVVIPPENDNKTLICGRETYDRIFIKNKAQSTITSKKDDTQ